MSTWANRHWTAMGSPCQLMVHGDDPESVADEAVAEVERLEACWSRFRPDSELSELNRSDGRWFPASPTLWDALWKARAAWVASDGLFDPTIARRLAQFGYDRTFRSVSPSAAGPVNPTASVGLQHVRFDEDRQSICVPPAMGIDLGGIGKGLAADIVTAQALARGATSVCLSLGGDIRVRGPGPDADATWRLEIQHPADGRVLGAFALSDEALVQSTTLFRRWERDGRALHHLIDPRTGQPSATDLVGAVVTGVDAWWAEVVAKVAIMLGATEGLAFLIRSEVDGWLLAGDGALLATVAVAGDLEAATS